jgi:uncharacterized membrane protein
MSDYLVPETVATYARAGALGITVGLRSMTPFAILAAVANQRPIPAAWSDAGQPWRLLRSRGALAALSMAALGELVVDKLPATPSRLKPPALGARLVGGALVGALLARSRQQPAVVGGLIGALAAGAGATAGYYTRQALDRTTGWPDPVWAVAEDIIAVSLGIIALRPDWERRVAWATTLPHILPVPSGRRPRSQRWRPALLPVAPPAVPDRGWRRRSSRAAS